MTPLVRGAIGTLALRAGSVLLGLAATLALARLLGPSGYGAYAWALAWVAVLRLTALVGLDRLLIREIAVYRVRADWAKLRGLLRRSSQAVLLSSLFLLGIAFLVSIVFPLDDALRRGLWIALPLIPISALLGLEEATLQGFEKIVLSQVPNLILRPLFLLGLLGAAYAVLGNHLGVGWALGTQIVASLVALAAAVRLVAHALPPKMREAMPSYAVGVWIKSALPMLLIGGVITLNDQVDILVVGAVRGAHDAGVYSVAARGAALLTLIMIALNTSLGPRVAALRAEGRREELQKLATHVSRVALAGTIVCALVLALAANPLLDIFGDAFGAGSTAFRVLLLGYVGYAAAAPSATILVMSGYERQAAVGIGAGAVLNLALNLAFVPLWGIEGAAIAAASSVVFWNVLLVRTVFRRLGMDPTAVGVLRRAPV